MTRTWRTALIAAFAVASLGSCGRTSRPMAPEPTAPHPTSPALAVKMLEWAIANRDVDMIAGLLTSDMVFLTAGLDSAGNPARVPKDRDWVLAALRSLLLGVPGQFEPAEIHLSFDRDLIPFPDPRPGHVDSLFKTVRTSVDLKVRDPSTSNVWEVTGYLLFFAVRGDTASIPPDRVGEPGVRESTRWWFSRIEDETIEGAGAPGSSGHPSRRETVGSVLEYYWLRAEPAAR